MFSKQKEKNKNIKKEQRNEKGLGPSEVGHLT